MTDNDTTSGPVRVAKPAYGSTFALLTSVDAGAELVSRPMAHQEVEADSDKAKVTGQRCSGGEDDQVDLGSVAA